MKSSRLINLLLIVLLLSQPLAQVFAAPTLQEITPQEQALELMETLSPEEKIGQLFMVEFEGQDTSELSEINNLISNYHIGGVVLKRENDNFSGPEDLIANTQTFIQALQNIEFDDSLESFLNPDTLESSSNEYIPLFIALSQDGDITPNDQILSALSPQPSKMALGATWNTELAYRAGEILGYELQVLGFNLLIGPSLNVLSTPRPENSGDININSFGGNPEWVAEMGEAYVAGLHTGSYNNILVIAKDFPGVSSPDRPLNEEIPIIRKPLEELTLTDLLPFAALTDLNSGGAIVDGLQISNAKYEALQGTIRPATRPLSFDESNLQTLINQPEFLDWKTNGGLLVSDNLSTNAIQRFYTAQEEEFDVRLVALNAFLAGNEILNLGKYNFESLTTGNSYSNITDTIDFFVQKYQEDELFAQKVDAVVLTILSAKFRIFSEFEIINVIEENIDSSQIGLLDNNALTTALEAATLIYPSIDELDISMPEAPLPTDTILVITDTTFANQCSECPEIEILSTDAFKQAALKLYGPDAGSRTSDKNMISYSIEDLTAFLNLEDNGDFSQFQYDVTSADWVIFLLQEINGAHPDSQSLQQLINEHYDLLQQKKIIVFALNAPYYLDATLISNSSVVFGIYSKQPQFIDVAVRLLFKELSAQGASPVSIESAGYDLSTALSPAPDQVILLRASLADQEVVDGEEIIEVTEFDIGSTLQIESNSILDKNGQSVPDKTGVNFTLITIDNNEIINEREILTETDNGIATAIVTLDNAGAVTVSATVSETVISEVLKLDIIDINTIPTEVVITETPEPETQPTEQPYSFTNEILAALAAGQITMSLWLLMVTITLFVSIFVYQVAINSGMIRWGIRLAFTTFIGGVLAIITVSSRVAFAFIFPGQINVWQIVLVTIVGCLLGWFLGIIWKMFSKN